MKRRMFFLAALATVFLVSSISGEEIKKPEKQKKPELSKVLVFNGYQGKLQLTDLKDEFQLIAIHLSHKNATYTVEGSTLKIGIVLPGIKDGVTLEKIVFHSDCVDNSQYRVNSLLVKREPILKRTIVAWTRHRHRAPKAPLRVVNIRQVAGLIKHYDVQLELRQLSSLDIPIQQ